MRRPTGPSASTRSCNPRRRARPARPRRRSRSSQTVFVIIENFLSAAGTFELTTNLISVPAGDRCEDAVAITAGTLTGESTSSYNDDLAPTSDCTGFEANGADKVYSINVPAGK